MERPLEQYAQAQRYVEAMSAPYLAAEVSDDNQCTEIGKLLIQSLLLLHGGGLLVVATFAGSPIGGRIVVVVLAIGLFLTLLGGYQAFLALSHRSRASSARVKEVGQRAWAQVLDLEHARTENPALKNEADRAKAEADRIAGTVQPLLDVYAKYHHDTVDLLLLSAFLLVVAACLGALALK